MIETDELARSAIFVRELCRSAQLVFNQVGKSYQCGEKAGTPIAGDTSDEGKSAAGLVD